MPGGDPGFGVGDVVMVSDCEQAAVFRITGMNVAGNTATLIHATATAGDPFENADVIQSPTGLIPYTLSFLGRSYGEEAVVGNDHDLFAVPGGRKRVFLVPEKYTHTLSYALRQGRHYGLGQAGVGQ